MKARLTSQHYMFGRTLDAGTLIGDDTPYPLSKEVLSIEMEPLDDEAKSEIEAHHEVVRQRQQPNFDPGTGNLSLGNTFPMISRQRPDGTFGPPAIFGNEVKGDVDQVPVGAEKPIRTEQQVSRKIDVSNPKEKKDDK